MGEASYDTYEVSADIALFRGSSSLQGDRVTTRWLRNKQFPPNVLPMILQFKDSRFEKNFIEYRLISFIRKFLEYFVNIICLVMFQPLHLHFGRR